MNLIDIWWYSLHGDRPTAVSPSIHLSVRSSIHLPTYLCLFSYLLSLDHFFSFFIFYTVGMIPWTGDQPVARPLRTHRTTQIQNKRTQTFMSRMGFEPTIQLFEWAKAVHAIDCAATVIGSIDSVSNYSGKQTSKIADTPFSGRRWLQSGIQSDWRLYVPLPSDANSSKRVYLRLGIPPTSKSIVTSNIEKIQSTGFNNLF
jgi:hypothetical protein